VETNKLFRKKVIAKIRKNLVLSVIICIFAADNKIFTAMKQFFISMFALAVATTVCAETVTVTVSDTRKQTITGFGAACCDGAMCPYGTDTKPRSD